ncbi:MAG: isoprenylcysteine carboxylmethyltransferase family protein [Thermoproteota archaeon]
MLEQALWVLVSMIGFPIIWIPNIKPKNLRIIANWIGMDLFIFSWFWMPFTAQPKISGLLGVLFVGGGIPLFIFGMIFVATAARKILKVVGPAGHAVPASLVTDGPYRFVRHPLYCGLFLGMLGWSLIWGGVYSIFLMPVLYLILRIEARLEEKQVEKKFGDLYVDYRKKTPAFFPVILTIPLTLIMISIIVGIWLDQIPLV